LAAYFARYTSSSAVHGRQTTLRVVTHAIDGRALLQRIGAQQKITHIESRRQSDRHDDMQLAAWERMARQAHPSLALENRRRVAFDVVEPLRRLSTISHGAISILLDIAKARTVLSVRSLWRGPHFVLLPEPDGQTTGLSDIFWDPRNPTPRLAPVHRRSLSATPPRTGEMHGGPPSCVKSAQPTT
jgi:hypothetical protein